jgi:hypothetical protein
MSSAGFLPLRNALVLPLSFIVTVLPKRRSVFREGGVPLTARWPDFTSWCRWAKVAVGRRLRRKLSTLRQWSVSAMV